MSATAFRPEDLPSRRLALGQRRSGNGDGYEPVELEDFGAAEAAGGLYSTLADLARFAAFELDAWSDGATADNAVLSTASRRESQTPASLPIVDGDFCGVNWFISQFGDDLGRTLSHSGRVQGYSSRIELFPARGFATIALTSSGEPRNADLLQDVSHTAARLLRWTLPATDQRLNEPLRAALERLMATINAPPSALGLKSIFAWPEEELPGLAEGLAELHTKAGVCSGPPQLVEAGTTRVIALFRCNHLPVKVDVTLDPPTGRIGMLLFWYP